MTEMTVIEISESGGPEVLVPAKRPMPQAGPGQVLIRIASAGVNGPDIMQRQGRYAPPPGASDLPGLEVAGEIASVGEGVTRVKDVMIDCPVGGARLELKPDAKAVYSVWAPVVDEWDSMRIGLRWITGEAGQKEHQHDQRDFGNVHETAMAPFGSLHGDLLRASS